MRFDVHIHHSRTDSTGAQLLERMNKAGIDGGAILSQPPFSAQDGPAMTAAERIQDVISFTKGCDTLAPFFFIDPTEDDADKQVDMAIDAGIAGFKTICTHFYPYDERAIPIYHKVAQLGKPYLFHSGILYDAFNASGNFNRPCNFEILLSVPKLRFALAHISWPWYDECIAVYGKFNCAMEHYGKENAPEMFIDLSPGTPPVYRREALTHLMGMGNASDHIVWGVDGDTSAYDIAYAQSIRDRDESIFRDLGYGDDFLEQIYNGNFIRFLKGK